MYIRIATNNDVDNINTIWREGIHTAIGAFAANTVNHIDTHSYFLHCITHTSLPFGIWVAFDESNTITGWTSLLPFDTNPAMKLHVGEASTYVATAMRGQGVGKVLNKHLINEINNSSLYYVIGFISEYNISSLKFCLKYGWIKTGTILSNPLTHIVSYVPLRCACPDGKVRNSL